MKVLLDTSLLMLIVEQGRDLIRAAEDILGEVIEPYILEDTVDELEKIAKRRGGKAELANLALKLTEKMVKIKYVKELPVDLKLIEAAQEHRMVLAAVDQKMIKEARKKKIPLIIFHKDLRVTFEGWTL
jgi:rRNA-processing protein FCF1